MPVWGAVRWCRRVSGFLGTNATRTADLNLVIQVAIAVALTIGMFLARRQRFRAHGWTQTTVLVLNLVAIVSVMEPSFHRQVMLRTSGGWRDAYYAVPTIHAVFGTFVELLGVYVVLVAGTRVLPARLRFRNYKLWMRTTLALWWVVVMLGLATYYVWYVRPAPRAAQGTPGPAPQASLRITVMNFRFEPGEVTVKAGSIVEWEDTKGRHQIVADDGSFQSDVLLLGARYRHTFTKAGTGKSFFVDLVAHIITGRSAPVIALNERKEAKMGPAGEALGVGVEQQDGQRHGRKPEREAIQLSGGENKDGAGNDDEAGDERG